MTKDQFDQFKNKILELSGDADVFWEEFQTLQTTNEKAIHLLQEKNYQLEVRTEELQKAKNEVKKFKSHLQEALKKIKQLEEAAPRPLPSQPTIKESPTDIIDLKKIASDFDTKLEKEKEEKILHYWKKW